MRAASRRGLFRVHAWIGLNLGLLLFVICFSGTVAVFSAELSWLADPGLRVAPPANGDERRPLSWQGMHDAVAAAHPHGRIVSLHAPDGDGFAAIALLAYAADDHRIALVNPYTGRVQGHRSSVTLSGILRIFHKQLYLVPTVAGWHGTLAVGALGLPLLLAAITGIVSVRRWWRALVTVRTGRSARLFWSDMHRATGLWSLLIALLLCITGLWYFAEIVMERTKLLPDEPRAARVSAETMRQMPADLLPLDLDRAVALAQTAYPALTIMQVRLPVRPGDALVMTGPAEAWLSRERANAVQMNPYTGDILQIHRAIDLDAFPRWVEMADPLHFGTFAGLTSRILWFVAGLLLSGGILAGLYGAWLRLRQNTVLPPQTRLIAIVVVLPTLGLLLAAMYGSWAYSGGFMRQAQRTIQIVTLAQPVLGARQTTLYWIDPAATRADGVMTVSLRFAGAAQPNLRQVRLWLDDTPQGEPALLLSDRATARLTLPTGRCADGCRLQLVIEDWDGLRQQAVLPLRLDDPALLQGAAPMPAAETMGAGSKAVLAIFVLCLLLPVWGWVVLQWRLNGARPASRT